MYVRSTIARDPGSRRDLSKTTSLSFGEEEISPRARIASALCVLTPLALSGVFLVAFVPQLWWIFTTYFWIAFPALGSLRRALTDAIEERPHRPSDADTERELLFALKRHGELTSGLAAAETSLPVAEADRRLGELARDGYLEVRARGGAIFYALWDVEPEARKMRRLASVEDGP